MKMNAILYEKMIKPKTNKNDRNASKRQNLS